MSNLTITHSNMLKSSVAKNAQITVCTENNENSANTNQISPSSSSYSRTGYNTLPVNTHKCQSNVQQFCGALMNKSDEYSSMYTLSEDKYTFETMSSSLDKTRSTNDCMTESQNGYDLSTLSNFSTDVSQMQSLIQRQTETVERLKQLNMDLLKLLHEEWSITGTVPPGYESLCSELGICNKPLKNTSYPLSHLLVHKVSTVSTKAEYYEYLENKRKFSPLINMMSTRRSSIRSRPSKIQTVIGDCLLSNEEVTGNYHSKARRLVQAFGRSISTELFPNKQLNNLIGSLDTCSNLNSSTHDYNTVSFPLNKRQYCKDTKIENSLTPLECYRVKHMTMSTSISDYSSFLSTDYSPTAVSLSRDYQSLKNAKNKNEARVILSDLSSNSSTNINANLYNDNENIHNTNYASDSDDDITNCNMKFNYSINKEIVESEGQHLQFNFQSSNDSHENVEDIRRATYEIELKRLEVDFAVISQLYSVHKQRAKETKCESYKIAYKSNSKKLKDITQQINHIKTVLLSNDEKSENQTTTSSAQKLIQKQAFRRRKTWNPLKLSTSNWTGNEITSHRLSKHETNCHGYSSPVIRNTDNKVSNIPTKPGPDCFTGQKTTTVIRRRLQNIPARHTFIRPISGYHSLRRSLDCRKDLSQKLECRFPESSKCFLTRDTLPTDPESNPPNPFNKTPSKKDASCEKGITAIPFERSTDISSYESNYLHSVNSATVDPLKRTSLDGTEASAAKIPDAVRIVTRDREGKYTVNTHKRCQSLSSELFILSVDDTFSLPRGLLNKIARVRSLPHFNSERVFSSNCLPGQNKMKKCAVSESYSVDGKLKNLKIKPTSVTIQSSGIGLNNSSASVPYTDSLRMSNPDCLKCVPKKTTSSNTSSSNWSTSGCSCLSSQTTNSSPYEEVVSTPNASFNGKENQATYRQFDEVSLTFLDEYTDTPSAHNSEKTSKIKVSLRSTNKRGRRPPIPLMEVTNTQPFGVSVSARCICSCLSENGPAELSVCQCLHSENLIVNNLPLYTGTELPESCSHSKNDRVFLQSSVYYSNATQSVNLASDERLHPQTISNCYLSPNPNSHEKYQRNDSQLSFRTPTYADSVQSTKLSTLKRSNSGLKGRLSLKPLSLIRRAVSKVATHSIRRSLNPDSSFIVHQKTKHTVEPTILPSLITERQIDMKSTKRINETMSRCRKTKDSVNVAQDSCSSSSHSIFDLNNNANISRFTWARKLRYSIRPSNSIHTKCTN
ncbi:unnamed protein product [Trichobilharzia szidati]|nr:unnamed protein product [Trichobilharzia szidati]CAH8847415.1 unnamed protein product [Trichobilharzia szidati]